MKNISKWKLAAEKIADKTPSGYKTHRIFCAVLDFIHSNDWQGACHGSATVLHTLLGSQGIENHLCLGEVCYANIYFDHSWIEIEGRVYDAAISNTLVQGFYFPPVFSGCDLESTKPTPLEYGKDSGQGYSVIAENIKKVPIAQYMSLFPDHPDGLYGIAKSIGKSLGFRVTSEMLKKQAQKATWREKT